jgi:ABC-type sugar transport system ATPase subunit
MAFVELNRLVKRFGNSTTLHGIDLAIEEGEFAVFVGPSGCGKSTLLRLIAGLESATEGSINIAGQDMTHAPASARGVAMVFQSYALYPHMTVEENLTFGMRMRGVSKAVIAEKLSMAVDILRLAPYLARKPGEMSGGQCQRVAIGRALVQEPRLFLFDEPLSNLDAELRVSLREELATLHAQLKRTMIYVTHDQVEAMTLATRIVVLRDGRIEQVGQPMELYERPANRFVAGFIGSPAMNFLEGRHDGARVHLSGGQTVEGPFQGQAANGPCTLGIRPEHVDIASDGPLAAKVERVERLGAVNYVHATFAGGKIIAECRTSPPQPGTEVRLAFRRDRQYVFPAGPA